MLKEETLIIDDSGNSLTFKVRQMSAIKLESWIIRALLALTGGNKADLSNLDSAKASEMFSVNNVIGLISGLDYDKAKPLLDELLACCYRVDAGIEQQCTPDSVEGFIEDVRTLIKLRFAAAKLNLGFIKAGIESISQGGPRIKRPQKPQA